MDRSVELFSAVERFNDVHEAWVADQNAKHPTLKYWAAFEQMMDVINTGDMPANCRALATAAYRAAEERAKFDSSGDEHPHDGFWAARQWLHDVSTQLRSPTERRHRETIQELDRQKVPHEQIARIWGLRRPDGTGKAYLIQEELNRPGSVIGSDYVHPDDAKENDDMLAARRRYLTLAATVQQEAQVEAVEESKPCPETPRELWLIGVSTQQAAKMLKLDQSAVAKLWEGFEQEKLAHLAPVVTAEAPQGIPPVALMEDASEAVIPTDEDLLGDDIPPADEADDPRQEFVSWSDDEIKEEARRLKVALRGPFNRDKVIDRILEADAPMAHDEPLVGG